MNDGGPLDGVVLLRYAHIFKGRTSGGVEQYLGRLNHELLIRNRMTIIQMHLQREDEFDGQDLREEIGNGTLLWVPVCISTATRSIIGLASRFRRLAAANSSNTTGTVESRPALTRFLRRLWTSQATHLRYPQMILSERLIGLVQQARVDLMALHWFSYDARRLLSEANARRIPFVFVNHFDNARLALPEVRGCVAAAAAVGGVSSLGVPEFIRKQYVNLSDAVDTEFFSPANTNACRPNGEPLVLLPARVNHQKGHADVLAAAAILALRRCNIRLAFAGVTESRDLEECLRAKAANLGLGERVAFLGQLTPEALRECYAQSSIVVLPSHFEGLGRVLLEAQAMERPVIAYDTGGVRDALLQSESGLLVSSGHIQGLADAIHALLTDPVKAARMGHRGREFVTRNFSFAALVAKHESFYLTALGREERSRKSGGPCLRTHQS